MKTVVGLGELLWDEYPEFRAVGGAPTNAALHACQLGAHGVVVSAVGEDEAGEALIRQVQQMGGDIRCIQKHRIYKTGSVRVTLNRSGVPSFECSQNTAFDHLVWQDTLSDLAAACDAVIIGTLAQRDMDSRKVIQRFLDETSTALKVMDVNFRGWDEQMTAVLLETLKKVDIVKMNDQELARMRRALGRMSLSDEDFLQWLIQEYYFKAAALTLGAQGCLLVDPENSFRIKGLCVQAVDTTGCGDAFIAGLVVKWLEGASLEEAGQFANAAGAFTATKKGAVPKYRTEEIYQLV